MHSITHVQVHEIHNMDGKQTSNNTNFYKSKQYSTQKTAIIFPERQKEYCLIISGEWDKEKDLTKKH